MRTPFVLLAFAITVRAANNEKSRRPYNNSFEVKLTVPGKPGNDYPILSQIPRTSFSCSGKEPGYYADTETNCQVFHVCTFGSTSGYQSFLCPNGTLFNQAVYVCDWWMNVNCTKSKELYSYKSELGNSRIGPHFMRDIKKMITHPMRNPYEQTFDKNNLIIMQDYKLPNGQLYNRVFENSDYSNSNKIISHVKEKQQNVHRTTNISTTAISTPKTYYFSNFNIYPLSNKSVNFFQQKLQKLQQNVTTNFGTIQPQFSNSHSDPNFLSTPKTLLSYTKHLQNNKLPIQINQKSLQFYNDQYIQAPNQTDRIVINNQQSNQRKNTLGAKHLKQQLNQHIVSDKELFSYKSNQARFSKDLSNQVDKETKQNLVSNNTSPTLIRKTLAFREIIKDPKNGTPKSKITFKTWIIRPSKSDKLLAHPTPYTYNIPKNTIDNIIFNNDLNVITDINNTSEESIDQNNPDLEPYEYNPPVNPSIQILTSTTETPLTSKISFKTSVPTIPSLLYLPPTPLKDSPILYNLATDNIETQRQYLVPSILKSSLTALGSSPIPFMQTRPKTKDKVPTFPLNKHTLSNTNHNNLVYSDTRSKDHFDITVNNILKDTSKLLKKISSNNIYGFKQEIQTIDYPEDNYLLQSIENQDNDNVVLKPSQILLKNSRLVTTPSIVLEPPVESYEYSHNNADRLSYLSSIKQPVIPSIERTVSIKITIPQKIAEFIFKKNISDNLEILNTANTNYFLVANKMSNRKESQYVPIGKLIWNNKSDISSSQDLVFSFLRDSINAAQKYNTIAQDSIAQTIPARSKFQDLNNNEIESISNKILQMTSKQLSNTKALKQSYSNNNLLNKEYTQIKSESTEDRQQKRTHQESIHIQQSTNKYLSNPASNLQSNDKLIYSGQLYQLPVPEVTKQFYNLPAQKSAKYSSNNKWQKHTQREVYKQSQPEFEITKSHVLPPESDHITSRQNQQLFNQGNTPNNFIDTIQTPKDSLTAQIQDNTIGTIPHPLNKDKLIKYKKDRIYYIYTNLNKNNDTSEVKNNNILPSNTVKNKFVSKPNSKMSDLIYQIIPSVGYELKTDNEEPIAENILQLDQFHNPKRFATNTHSNQQQENGADVNYVINHHPESRITSDNLYKGPSSYNAPQAVISDLDLTPNTQTEFNEREENVDNYETNGYPKVSPTKRFSF